MGRCRVFLTIAAWFKPSLPGKVIGQSARSILNSYIGSKAFDCEVFTSAGVEDRYKQSYDFPQHIRDSIRPVNGPLHEMSLARLEKTTYAQLHQKPGKGFGVM